MKRLAQSGRRSDDQTGGDAREREGAAASVRQRLTNSSVVLIHSFVQNDVRGDGR
jgi:hypothetical protein